MTYCKSKHCECHQACAAQLFDNYFGKLVFLARQPILVLLFPTSLALVLFLELSP